MNLKLIKRLVGTVTFLFLFRYFYKRSGKFRQSIIYAFVALTVLLSNPLNANAGNGKNEADAFTAKYPTHRGRPSNSGMFSNGSGSPDDNGSGGGGGGSGGDDDSIPEYPHTESVAETKQRIEHIDYLLNRMNQDSDSDTECEVTEQPKLQSVQITPTGIKRSMTSDDYNRLSVDPKTAREKYAQEWLQNIQQSKEHYELPSYKSKPTKAFPTTAFINKKVNQETGKVEIEASFINTNSREALIRTQLSEQEYENLKKSSTEKTEFLLTDLDRDPQTWTKNNKSVKELDIIQNAAEEGLVNMQDIRRPIEHRNETTGDFINSQTGETYELKSISQFVSSSGKGDKSFTESASDIANSIIKKLNQQNLPVADKYFVNAREVPKLQQQEYIDQIQEQLEKANVLQKIDITFLKN